MPRDIGAGSPFNIASIQLHVALSKAPTASELTDGMMPTGADFATTGVSLDDLVEAWDAPFNSDDAAKGGCPAIPVAY